MRIVAGAFRGRPLAAPRGEATRPTADRVRQALFDVLGHAPWAPSLAGLRAIDLFAGSGALGLEALSRGAAFCLFVERAPTAREAIAGNARSLGVLARVRVDARDAARLGARGVEAPFALAFLDPPYGKGLAETALEGLRAGGWLETGAVAVVEQSAREPALTAPAGYAPLDARAWGAARVGFLRAG